MCNKQSYRVAYRVIRAMRQTVNSGDPAWTSSYDEIGASQPEALQAARSTLQAVKDEIDPLAFASRRFRIWAYGLSAANPRGMALAMRYGGQ